MNSLVGLDGRLIGWLSGDGCLAGRQLADRLRLVASALVARPVVVRLQIC